MEHKPSRVSGQEPCTEESGNQPTGKMRENCLQTFLSSKSHLSCCALQPQTSDSFSL